MDSQSDIVDNSCKDISSSTIELVDTNPYSLAVGSVIQHGDPVQCGVIKWIGNFSNETEMFAGVEMVRDKYFIISICNHYMKYPAFFELP